VTEVKPKQQRPQARVRIWGSILLSADCPEEEEEKKTFSKRLTLLRFVLFKIKNKA